MRRLCAAMEPFFTTKGLGKGTGLGLSMVHGFAEQSGGCFTLAQPEGQRHDCRALATGCQSSPARRSLLTRSAQAAPAKTIRPLTVLAVDDDALVLMNTVAMLEDLGHSVFEAYSGREALEILRREDSVDLVITDQAMPQMTGTATCQSHQTRMAGYDRPARDWLCRPCPRGRHWFAEAYEAFPPERTRGRNSACIIPRVGRRPGRPTSAPDQIPQPSLGEIGSSGCPLWVISRHPAPQPSDAVTAEPPPQRITNPTAVFAGLDKITGRIISFDVAINETVQFGALQMTPRVCYSSPPTETPNTDAFVEVDEVTLQEEIKRIFTGWMFAASPGLHAVEHPIYDVWITDCKGGQSPTVAEAPAEAPKQPPRQQQQQQRRTQPPPPPQRMPPPPGFFPPPR